MKIVFGVNLHKINQRCIINIDMFMAITRPNMKAQIQDKGCERTP